MYNLYNQIIVFAIMYNHYIETIRKSSHHSPRKEELVKSAGVTAYMSLSGPKHGDFPPKKKDFTNRTRGLSSKKWDLLWI